MNRIAIHSVPRSGSSWIGQIFNSSPEVNYKFQPLFSYEFKDYLNDNSTKHEIDGFFNQIAISGADFLLQTDKVAQGIYPRFFKNKEFRHIVYKEVRYHHILTNLLSQDRQLIVVGIIRSPFAVVNSFLRSPREFRKDLGWVEEEEWRLAAKKNLDKKEEFFGLEKWKEVVRLFNAIKEAYSERVYLIMYEKFLSNPVEETKRVFDFCGIEYTRQTEQFLRESRSVDRDGVYSVYRTKTTDDEWKMTLSPSIALGINEALLGEEIFREFVLSKKEVEWFRGRGVQ
jgi:hypothetical protein